MSRYQGWKNAQTWCVALTMDNEKETQDEMIRLTRRFEGNPEMYLKKIQDYVFYNAKKVFAMAPWAWEKGELILKETDWNEIVNHYQDKVKEHG